ncbi:hypothetical protein C1T20_00830 [Paenibacillus polymyxa]|nr:hypothetical protein C1T20_00830 [Paenibacillus polymyxa]
MDNKRELLLLNLRRIQQEENELYDKENVWDYALLMIEYIGDPDPELRDDLIYSTLCSWIMEKNLFEEKELLKLLSLVINSDHLFYRLGADGDNSVYTRTFSVLIVAQIICRHRHKPFLDRHEVLHVKDVLIRYLTEEKDLRGFTYDNGWAHGAAHGADALDELVQCEECTDEVYKEALFAIQKVLSNGRYIFQDEEDERLACIVQRIIRANRFASSRVMKWIENLSQCMALPRSRSQFVIRVNVKNFLRSLYFRMRSSADQYSDLLAILHQTENKLNKFV